jgi:uncharacterized protein
LEKAQLLFSIWFSDGVGEITSIKETQDLGATPQRSQPRPGPVTRTERIASIDTLRGIALLWILFSNMDIFSGPETFFELPQGLPDTTFMNAHLHLNLLLLLFKWITTEGKARFVFSMLFGVGLCLMTERAERMDRTGSLADIYLRRNFWLCVFGLLHGTLLWPGDILLSYGLAGLLVLYPCRKLGARTLLILGGLVTCVSSLFLPYFLGTAGDIDLSRQGQAVVGARQAGAALTRDQVKIEEQWHALQAAHAVVVPPLDGGRSQAQPYLATVASQLHALFTELLISRGFVVLEAVGGMLFGMGLYKIGFLMAKYSWRTYVWCACFGLLFSVPIYVTGMWKVYQNQFDFITAEIWLYLPYETLKLISGIGMISILMLFIKSNLFRGVKIALAAVGQMALTNYILTSLVCQWLFLWSPWALYGKLTYLQHHLVMSCVWVLNIAVSLLWLRSFQFGPLEWVWRSLTYWKFQPIRRYRSSLAGSLF